MEQFLHKTDFSEECNGYIEYNVDNATIILNPHTVSWVTLSKEEYRTYCSLKSKQHIYNADEQKVIMKLIINNIIRFKNNIHAPKIAETPLSVYFAPTPRCNLHCVYCYADAQTPVENEQVYGTENVYKILDNILTVNIRSIYFTGGEPTLCKNLFDLVQYVKDRGVNVSILTNATLVNENNVNKFRIFDRVTVSLDASVADINDITRGKGSFDRIVPSIKLLKDNKIEVAVTSVISKKNLENVPSLLKFVGETLEVTQHNVSLYVSHGRAKTNSDTMECSYEEVVAFRKQYIEYLIKNKKPEETIHLFNPNIQKGMIKNLCGVASSEIFVDSKGFVYPCRLFEDESHVLGNVSELPLATVLQNSKTTCFKEKLCVDAIPECSACEMKNLCGGGCRSSHACYTGDVMKSYTPFCNIIKNDIRNAILLNSGYNPITLKELR